MGSRTSIHARIARAGLAAMSGWRFVGEIPSPPRCVCLAVPHTATKDGLLLVLLAQSVGMRIEWMVKDAWGRGLLGPVVRAVGGVPIDRSARHGMVEQMIEQMAKREHFHLVIPPEGTRARAEHWKSGFYRIALGAGVPVVPGFLDYRARTGGFGAPIDLTGDVKADMDRIRAVYRDAAPMARYPEQFGPIRLREEDA